MRELKTRWVLGTGFPFTGMDKDVVGLFRDRDGYQNVIIGLRIPKSALTGKNKYRLILEIVEPVK
jgi:hypothetical protein